MKMNYKTYSGKQAEEKLKEIFDKPLNRQQYLSQKEKPWRFGQVLLILLALFISICIYGATVSAVGNCLFGGIS